MRCKRTWRLSYRRRSSTVIEMNDGFPGSYSPFPRGPVSDFISDWSTGTLDLAHWLNRRKWHARSSMPHSARDLLRTGLSASSLTLQIPRAMGFWYDLAFSQIQRTVFSLKIRASSRTRSTSIEGRSRLVPNQLPNSATPRKEIFRAIFMLPSMCDSVNYSAICCN